MPFRPIEIVIHPDVESDYESWEDSASMGRQPAQAVWRSFQTALQ